MCDGHILTRTETTGLLLCFMLYASAGIHGWAGVVTTHFPFSTTRVLNQLAKPSADFIRNVCSLQSMSAGFAPIEPSTARYDAISLSLESKSTRTFCSACSRSPLFLFRHVIVSTIP